MKKINFSFLGIAALALTSCSSDEVVNETISNGGVQKAISFVASQKNMTRATNYLENEGTYSFGVWGYKYSTTPSSAENQTVMKDYLVGYSNGTDGYPSPANSDTWNASAGQGNTTDGKSLWYYEGLGNTETNGVATAHAGLPTSTNDKQYMKYWDKAFTNTNFYAYTPYNAGVTFALASDGKGTMTFPAQTLKASYRDNATSNANITNKDQFMFAGTKATNADGNDVQLQFQHMSSRIKLAFYDGIDGYSVELLDLGAESSSNTAEKGVQVTPAIKTVSGGTTTYTKGSYGTTASASVAFNTNAVGTLTTTIDGETKTDENLEFKIATGTIETSSTNPTVLPTAYYAIPQNLDEENIGFTFHVTFKLTADDTNETIIVHNATVFVPAEFFKWEAGKQYTYVFKITKDATGNTNPGTFNPDDQTPGTGSLKPIVFDNITVVDWTEDVKHEAEVK